jgi:hypothetical protein
MAFGCHSPPLICLGCRMGREADSKIGDHSSSYQQLNHNCGERQHQRTPSCSMALSSLPPRCLVQKYFSQITSSPSSIEEYPILHLTIAAAIQHYNLHICWHNVSLIPLCQQSMFCSKGEQLPIPWVVHFIL